MFLGQYRYAIDNKGRMVIPRKFREYIGEGAYITQGFERNLRLLPVPMFNAIFERLNRMNVADPATRQLRRLIFASAKFVKMDRVGRILIPQFLMDIAGLKNQAIVVGVGDSLEIWAPEAWDEQVALLQDPDANSQRYASLDLSFD